jgi:hypothetical protein
VPAALLLDVAASPAAPRALAPQACRATLGGAAPVPAAPPSVAPQAWTLKKCSNLWKKFSKLFPNSVENQQQQLAQKHKFISNFQFTNTNIKT